MFKIAALSMHTFPGFIKTYR